MFEQLFTQPATIAHHHSSPYATERRHYLTHLMEEGRSRNSLRIIAELLMSYMQHLPLHRADFCASDIKASAEAWAETRHRSPSSLRSGKREFVFHATKWMRLLGRLHEPQQDLRGGRSRAKGRYPRAFQPFQHNGYQAQALERRSILARVPSLSVIAYVAYEGLKVAYLAGMSPLRNIISSST